MKFLLVFLLIVCQNLFAWSFFGTPDTLRANKKVAAPYGDFDSISVDSIITGNITADTLKSSAITVTGGNIRTTGNITADTLKSSAITVTGGNIRTIGGDVVGANANFNNGDIVGDSVYARSVTAETITAANVLSSITRESGSTNWGMYLGRVMLNDDEEINITTAFNNVPAGHVVMGFIKICSDISGECILGEIAYMVGEYLSVVTDASNSLATSDTDGKVCFYVSGATLMLKNRMGKAVGFKLAGFITVS